MKISTLSASCLGTPASVSALVRIALFVGVALAQVTLAQSGGELIAAVKSADTAAARRLAQAGADLEIRDRMGRTALVVAANQGNAELVRLFLSAGAKVTVADAKGNTALYLAARGGYDTICTALLGRGTDPNVRNAGGYSALMAAGIGGYTGVITHLLEHGADISAATPSGATALLFAAGYEYKAMLTILFERATGPMYFDSSVQVFVVSGGALAAVEALLKYGADVNHRDNDGVSAYMLASCFDHVEVMRLLAGAGADTARADNDGNGPEQWERVRSILPRGADR